MYKTSDQIAIKMCGWKGVGWGECGLEGMTSIYSQSIYSSKRLNFLKFVELSFMSFLSVVVDFWFAMSFLTDLKGYRIIWLWLVTLFFSSGLIINSIQILILPLWYISHNTFRKVNAVLCYLHWSRKLITIQFVL